MSRCQARAVTADELQDSAWQRRQRRRKAKELELQDTAKSDASDEKAKKKKKVRGKTDDGKKKKPKKELATPPLAFHSDLPHIWRWVSQENGKAKKKKKRSKLNKSQEAEAQVGALRSPKSQKSAACSFKTSHQENGEEEEELPVSEATEEGEDLDSDEAPVGGFS